MSYRDAIPCIKYKRSWEPSDEIRTVKIEQYYDDDLVRKETVPLDNGERGIEFFINVTLAEYMKAAEKLTYAGRDLFDNFDRCLTGMAEQRWKRVIRGITDAQKTEARFRQVLQEFYKDWVGEGQRDVLGMWMEHFMVKPRNATPLEHAQRIYEMSQVHNALDGRRAELDEDGQKHLFFATHPAKFRTEYLKSARSIYTDSFTDVIRFMTILYELEEQGRFGNVQHNAGNKRANEGEKNEMNRFGRGRNQNKRNKNNNDKNKPYDTNLIDVSKDCPIHPGKGHKWAGCFQNPKGDNFKPKGQGSPGRGAPPRKGGGGARQDDRKGSDKNIKKENYYHEPAAGSDKPDQLKQTNETHHMDLIGQCFYDKAESGRDARLQWS